MYILFAYYHIEFYHKYTESQGTGSYPNPPPGRHRETRLIPIQTPRKKPYFSIDWRAYSLQVGIKRHAQRPPINGEIHD